MTRWPAIVVLAVAAAVGSDPWTRRLSADEFAAFVREVSGQAHTGIGLPELLSVDLDGEGKVPIVVTPLPGSPAARAGLRPHDVIVAIDAAPTAGMPWGELMKRLRGPAKTFVKLQLQRAGKRVDVTLPREELPAVAHDVRSGMAGGVLHIAIERFSARTPTEVRAALAAAPGTPVVVDLRNDPGGRLDSALAVSGIFTGDVEVARLRVGEERRTLNAQGPAVPARRIAVIVNEGTASAAELVGSALSSAARAHIVGATTMRKCLVHKLSPLPEGGMLLSTSGRLERLDGVDICAAGVRIDERVAWDGSATTPLPVPAASGDLQFRAAAHALR